AILGLRDVQKTVPMINLDYSSFRKLARESTLVPVVKTVAADLLTPVSAFLTVAEREPNAFLLESVEGGEKIGRYTFLGIRPYMRVLSFGPRIIVERGPRCQETTGNIFQVAKDLLSQHRAAMVEGLPPFTAGAVGYFSYDVVRQLEHIGEHAAQDVAVPDCVLMFFDRVLAFDHVRHQIQIIASADVSRENVRPAYDRAVSQIRAIEARLTRGLPQSYRRVPAVSPEKLVVHQGMPRKRFMDMVERAREYIAAGDVFQVVLSQRIDFNPGASPFDLYRALRTVNPSPYMYYLRMQELDGAATPSVRSSASRAKKPLGKSWHVLGSSPEMLVRVTGRKLEYRPIAGTHPRGRDDAEDARLEQQMRSDQKERAEHVMLVDLGRNDLGRVSEYGSVKIRDLMFVERYSHVMHLVSALEGQLRNCLHALDAF